MLESEIDEAFDQEEAIEILDNYHKENLYMYKEIEQLKNDKAVIEREFSQYREKQSEKLNCLQNENQELIEDKKKLKIEIESLNKLT